MPKTNLSAQCPVCNDIISAPSEATDREFCGCKYLAIDSAGRPANLQGPAAEAFYAINPNIPVMPAADIKAANKEDRELEKRRAEDTGAMPAGNSSREEAIAHDPVPHRDTPARSDRGGASSSP